jgi:nuclear pore complex protein Nup188
VDPENTYNLPLQSLVALISLAVLHVPAAIETLEQISAGSSPSGLSEENVAYLLNLAAISEINEILIDVAAVCFTNASPAVLAWGVILQTIREYAFAFRESREARQSAYIAEKDGATDSYDTDTRDPWQQKGPSSTPRLSSTSSESSIQTFFLDEVLEKVMDTTLAEDPISYLAKSALDGSRVLDVITALATDYCSIFASDHQEKQGLVMRRMLLDLIRAVLDWIDYEPTLIHAVLAVLTGNLRYWDILDRPPSSKRVEPANFFLSDDILMHKLFYISLARFPYESLPFLRISKALALSSGKSDEGLPEIFSWMQNVNSLTSVMPPGFSAYEIIQVDEESNYIQLTDDLNMFDDHLRDLPLRTASSNSITRVLKTSALVWDSQKIPSGTSGRVISESKPLVVMWQFNYSPLTYLGKILESASMNGSSYLTSSSAAGPTEVVSEIIDLLSILMWQDGQHGSENQGQYLPREAARVVLEIASDGLDRNQDIVSVIFQIFENELHRRQNLSEQQSSFDVLVPCIQFIHALISVMPDRVWPFLARSSLLGVGSVENQFNSIIGSSEIIPGHYSFLIGCIRVFDALIEDTITRAVSQRVVTTAVTRFTPVESQGSRVSCIMMEKVLDNYQQMMMTMLESPQSWKSAPQRDKFEINHTICSAFVKILSICYDIDDQVESSRKIAGPLITAADYLINAFRLASNNSFKIHALLQILLEGMDCADSSLSIRGMQYLTSQTVSALNLITTLIRVNKLLGHAPQRLEEHIFKASPILAKLYATHERYRFPIVDLFEALVTSAATIDQQPPSLLGHLGEVPARSFLEMLSMMDQPYRNDDLSIAVWRLLSTIISRRQQWFAVFVLTGNTPRGTLKESKKDAVARSKISQPSEPLLAQALDELSNLERLKPTITLAMLEFASQAADYWPWVLNTMEDHPHFLGAVTEYIAFSQYNRSTSKEQVQIDTTEYTRLGIAALILNILAMYSNHTQKVGNSAYAKKLIPYVRLLAEIAASVPSYNASLHGNLRRNFETKFPGCEISQFKRSTSKRPMLGTSFYYNFELATKVLSFDPAWAGRRRGHGFANELLRANMNLSLVESQVVSRVIGNVGNRKSY